MELNLPHLRERLLESGYLHAEDPCSIQDVKRMLFQRFAEIDYEQAKTDVIPFIRDASAVSLWSEDFFQQITEELREQR